jgi:clan AA aspartic protease
MISGTVSAGLEACIRLAIGVPGGELLELDFTIDSGFNGWITLPPALVSQLHLPWRRRGRGELADGSESIFDIYEAQIVWDGQLRRVWVDEIDAAPLVGMSLLNGHEVTIQAWTDGVVTITARS